LQLQRNGFSFATRLQKPVSGRQCAAVADKRLVISYLQNRAPLKRAWIQFVNATDMEVIE
jgi:hypothetical protein